MESLTNLLPHDGDVRYWPGFIDKSWEQNLINHLLNEIQWIQEPIWMFGKRVMQPRLTALYGNPQIQYGYSGITMESKLWTDPLGQLKEKVSEAAGIEFSHALLNLYRDGQDSMGWHRDNEKVLGPHPVIASLSFGTARKFQLRPYATKKPVITQLLESGSLLLMRGSTQHHWEHQLPKTKQALGIRINLTFRKVNPPATAICRNL
jgi:alkylated DNA repair dioxygenase AlkB